MASNALTTFQGGKPPAHLDAFYSGVDANVQSRTTVPSLSYQGKTWTIAMDGNKTKLQRKNADGDMEPVTTMKVIVLDYAKRRGRAYYSGQYDPDKESAPVCWSDDGIAPPDNVPEKQHSKCEGCPRAIKGSKVVGDKQLTECSQHRMIAVIPAFGIGKFPALRLKIAITSDFDKQSPSAAEAATQGWYAFSNYMEQLNAMGVKHSSQVITKIKFDTNAAYPKLFFAADNWVQEAEDVTKIIEMVKDPETAKLLGGTWTPAGADGVKVEETTAVEAPATREQVASAEAATVDEDDGEIVLEGMDAPAATPTQGAAQAEPVVETATKPEPPKAAAKAETAAPAVSTNVDPEVAALLEEWGG